VDLFNDFYLGFLDARRINYYIITLLSKVKDAVVQTHMSSELPIEMDYKMLDN
jgi:hypothetical protein